MLFFLSNAVPIVDIVKTHNNIINSSVKFFYVYRMTTTKPNEYGIDEEVIDAGITPDSPFYGLERAMERVGLNAK